MWSGPKIFRRHRHLKRYRQIISVLTLNGFGLLLDQVGIYRRLSMFRKGKNKKEPERAEVARLSVGERLRCSFEELGPTFVKIGQILSTRPDVLSPQVAAELAKLQETVHPFAFETAREVLHEELGKEIEQVFSSFAAEPLAAASLSQVHRAVLPDGRQVAVKIQRPGIKEQIAVDLEILEDLVALIIRYTSYGSLYDFSGMLIELRTSLSREVNFKREGQNAERFRRESGVSVPEIFWDLTTERILTMSFIEGMRINQTEQLRASGIDCEDLAVRLARSLLNQVLKDGFFHADPHPGNLAILADGTIVFLDLGMTGRLSRVRRRQLSRLFIGIAGQNAHAVVTTIAEMGTLNRNINLEPFEREIDLLLEQFLTGAVSDIDIGDLLAHIFQLAYRYRVQIPGELTLLAKMLITLQGVLDTIDPDLNLMALMQPMAKKMIWDIWSWEQISDTIQREGHDYLELVRQTPGFLLNLERRIASDDYSIQLGIRDLDRVQKQLNRITNRLSFSIVLLAVCLIITGIIISAGFSIENNPQIETFYFYFLRGAIVVAGVILVALLLSVFRSRRL